MADFLKVMGMILKLFQLEFDVYGFTFSLWQVMMLGVLLSVVIGWVSHVFYEK